MNHSSIAIFTRELAGPSLANYTAALAKGLLDVGVSKLYVLYLSDGPGPNIAIPEGVNLVCLRVQRARWSPIALSRFLKEARPDVLISLSVIICIPAIFGWLLAGKGPTKLILSEHSTMSYKAYVEYKDDFRMRAQPWLARLLYPLADGLHTNSQEVLDDLLIRLRVPIQHNRAIATPNPVNIEAVLSYSRAESEHPWLQQKQRPVILSAARLVRQKNFSLLLEAFAIVRQRLDAKLIVLGEGPERNSLEARVSQLGLEQDVSLPGFSENPWSSMSKADVFVLSSEEEPFGLVLVEAMVCGVPVVATNAIGGGPRSILDNGRCGRLVPVNNVRALAEAILSVMTSQDLQNQLVAAGKQRCEMYRPELVAQEWLSFLQRL